MNKLLTLTMTAILAIGAACSGKPAANSTNSANSTTTNKTTAAPSSTTSTTAASGASAVVKEIYDHAIKRECSAIPPLLTEEFRKEAGTSKDMLDALCDSLTDSGKLTSVEVKSEDVKGDAATVKVTQTFKDGKKEDHDENMKKSADGKWLMAP